MLEKSWTAKGFGEFFKCVLLTSQGSFSTSAAHSFFDFLVRIANVSDRSDSVSFLARLKKLKLKNTAERTTVKLLYKQLLSYRNSLCVGL